MADYRGWMKKDELKGVLQQTPGRCEERKTNRTRTKKEVKERIEGMKRKKYYTRREKKSRTFVQEDENG